MTVRTPPGRRLRKFWLGAAAVVFALWGGSVAWSARVEAKRQVHLRELSSAINSALPVGSSPAQVVAFLDARHISHSEWDEKTRSLYASTAEERVNVFARTGVYIVFHFDENARMTEFSVHRGVTAL